MANLQASEGTLSTTRLPWSRSWPDSRTEQTEEKSSCWSLVTESRMRAPADIHVAEPLVGESMLQEVNPALGAAVSASYLSSQSPCPGSHSSPHELSSHPGLSQLNNPFRYAHWPVDLPRQRTSDTAAMWPHGSRRPQVPFQPLTRPIWGLVISRDGCRSLPSAATALRASNWHRTRPRLTRLNEWRAPQHGCTGIWSSMPEIPTSTGRAASPLLILGSDIQASGYFFFQHPLFPSNTSPLRLLPQVWLADHISMRRLSVASAVFAQIVDMGLFSARRASVHPGPPRRKAARRLGEVPQF
ncbi:hypothetical protein VTN00DRAFT_3425 [Thermoascus crustaceus]|uniref:uncharacterized protein n=1 Tax=Thermoascus crustaceus TaxID=5088 RepID=UPI003742B9A2